jgi:hypothetical protein
VRQLIRGLSALLLLFLPPSGCKDLGPPEAHVLSATVDSSSYRVNSSILLQIRNGGALGVDLESCCTSLAYYIDRDVGGRWQLEEARGIPCLLLCPSILLSIDPGGTYQTRLTLATPGQYRVRIPYRLMGQAEIAGEILSGTFVVQ